MKAFKAGYYADVTTWENDGDNYKTKTSRFNTFAELFAFVKFCEYFGSCNRKSKGLKQNFGNSDVSWGSGEDAKFGNDAGSYRTYWHPVGFYNYIKAGDGIVYQLLKSKLKGDETEEANIEAVVWDVMSAIGTWCDGEYIRVVETVETYYVKEDVTFPDPMVNGPLLDVEAIGCGDLS